MFINRDVSNRSNLCLQKNVKTQLQSQCAPNKSHECHELDFIIIVGVLDLLAKTKKLKQTKQQHWQRGTMKNNVWFKTQTHQQKQQQAMDQNNQILAQIRHQHMNLHLRSSALRNCSNLHVTCSTFLIIRIVINVRYINWFTTTLLCKRKAS